MTLAEDLPQIELLADELNLCTYWMIDTWDNEVQPSFLCQIRFTLKINFAEEIKLADIG